MIVDLPSTTTSAVNHELVELRHDGGAVTLARVLTLVIVTGEQEAEHAVGAANAASREHPCRILVLARGAPGADARLDAQVRVGGDAGASEVVVLRMHGALAEQGASVATPLLLPDTPVVVWWPGDCPEVPAQDPVGWLAQRRITDAARAVDPRIALRARREGYVDGDTDLAWTRLTTWRAQLAASLDQPPHEDVTTATVIGADDSPSADLLAGWLRSALDVPVRRTSPGVVGSGISSVVLQRPSGPVELDRPDGRVGVLRQPGQPERRVPLAPREDRECLAEELRRLDPDEIYQEALLGLDPAGPRSRQEVAG